MTPTGDKTREVRANKNHVCGSCGGLIVKGDIYHYYRGTAKEHAPPGIDPPGIDQYRQCWLCHSLYAIVQRLLQDKYQLLDIKNDAAIIALRAWHKRWFRMVYGSIQLSQIPIIANHMGVNELALINWLDIELPVYRQGGLDET